MLFLYNISTERDVTIIKLSGELIDRNQANKLIEEFDEMLLTKKPKFIFDLAELKYLNSSGLNVLINFMSKSRKEGGEIVIANVSKKVNELLIITKLTTLFTVTDSVEKGIAKFK